MNNIKNTFTQIELEQLIKDYLKQGKNKLQTDLCKTREAINIIAKDKTKRFIRVTERGLSRKEREFLSNLIISSMYQAFCYGYGVGKIEGATKGKVIL